MLLRWKMKNFVKILVWPANWMRSEPHMAVTLTSLGMAGNCREMAIRYVQVFDLWEWSACAQFIQHSVNLDLLIKISYSSGICSKSDTPWFTMSTWFVSQQTTKRLNGFGIWNYRCTLHKWKKDCCLRQGGVVQEYSGVWQLLEKDVVSWSSQWSPWAQPEAPTYTRNGTHCTVGHGVKQWT